MNKDTQIHSLNLVVGDLPHIRQHDQAGDEDDDAQHGAWGQHKGLLQGHEPPSQVGPNRHYTHRHRHTLTLSFKQSRIVFADTIVQYYDKVGSVVTGC